MQESCDENKSDTIPMIHFWRIIRYIFDLISHLFWKPNALEDSKTQVCPKSDRNTVSKISENKDYDFIRTSEAIDEIEKTHRNDNNFDDNVLIQRIIQGKNSKDTTEDKNLISKKTTVEVTMKRNYVRRNSKRFVIGDGEDDETIPVLPDITISETQDEPAPVTFVKENSYDRLAPRNSLT